MVTIPPSTQYDIAFQLLGAYHLVEWFRFTIFLVAVTLGANLTVLYYLLYLNTIFGVAAYIVTHVKRYDSDGKTCANYQEDRA